MMLRPLAVFAAVLWSLVARSGAAFAQPGSRIESPTLAELQALRPLAEHGAAALVFHPDAGPGARISLVVPVAAPLAAVRRALLDAERWPEYMPALRSVSLLSRRGRRAAYRFEVAASLLDVSATTSLVEVGERRVDFTVHESDFGVAAARWDLLDDGPGRTLLVVTNWSDPSQGHWLLRRAASSNQTAIAGMNLAVDLVLALSVSRRALTLAGTPTTARPAQVTAPLAPLTAATFGPWATLASDPRRYYVYQFALAPDGAVSQMTVLHQTWGQHEVLRRRLEDIEHYSEVLPGVRRSRVSGDATGDEVRADMHIDTPFDEASGTVVRRRDGAGAILLEGRSGELAGMRWRWDLTRDPTRGTLVALTGRTTETMASDVVRAAAGREPYLHVGLAALRQLMWMRYMLAGIPM